MTWCANETFSRFRCEVVFMNSTMVGFFSKKDCNKNGTIVSCSAPHEFKLDISQHHCTTIFSRKIVNGIKNKESFTVQKILSMKHRQYYCFIVGVTEIEK